MFVDIHVHVACAMLCVVGGGGKKCAWPQCTVPIMCMCDTPGTLPGALQAVLHPIGFS